MKPDTAEITWYERGDIAIAVDETAVNREVAMYERTAADEWTKQYSMPTEVERGYLELLDTAVSTEE